MGTSGALTLVQADWLQETDLLEGDLFLLQIYYLNFYMHFKRNWLDTLVTTYHWEMPGCEYYPHQFDPTDPFFFFTASWTPFIPFPETLLSAVEVRHRTLLPQLLRSLSLKHCWAMSMERITAIWTRSDRWVEIFFPLILGFLNQICNNPVLPLNS